MQEERKAKKQSLKLRIAVFIDAICLELSGEAKGIERVEGVSIRNINELPTFRRERGIKRRKRGKRGG